jgi:hypothetical protein
MTGDNRRPVLAANADGQFTVVWATGATDGDSLGIAGRRFGAGGLPEGEEFLVNSYTTGLQSLPAIASDEHGNVLVVWASENQDGSGFGVFGQAFDATGAPLGHEFRVNSYTSGNQGQGGTWWTRLAMTSHSDANFLVVWESGHDGNGSGLFGQRYDDILFRDGFDPIAPSPPPLALLAPPDGSVFSNYPRSLRLQWTPVADPPGLRYYVEMESWSGGWWGLSQGSGYYGNCVGLLATTTCTTLTFPGAQPGRWRVSAYDAAGWRVLGPTPWSRFLFVY